MLSVPSISTTLLFAAMAPLASFGQQPQALISGPSLGFVYDHSSRSLKPLMGNPASAMIGPSLDAGTALAAAAISPKQDYALVVTSNKNVMLIRLDGGIPQTSNLDVLPAAPDRVALSATGTAAALFYSATATIQVVTGLPGAPVFSSIGASALPGAVDALAVSDDGQILLVAVNGEGTAEVFLLAGGKPTVVLQAGRVAAMAFLHQSQDALVADSTKNQLVRLANLGSGGTASILARDTDGVASPIAVAASADNRTALIANSGSASVALVDLGAGATKVVPCQCTPTTLAALDGPSVFRLTEPTGQPITLLDQSGGSPVLDIVPPEPKTRLEGRIGVPERGVLQ